MSADKVVSGYEERISRFEQLLFSHYCDSRESRKKAAELQKELEATQAELAAERAKPKGGVAWAIKSYEGNLMTNMSVGTVFLCASKEDAQKYIDYPSSSIGWTPVPYPIGDGADELRAAIEAKEKAEAELAAWKAAAKHRYQDTILIESPDDLIRRIDNLKTDVEQRNKWVSELKAELAALKAAPAEVPPLDKWRVLATAIKITKSGHQNALSGTINESIWGAAYWGLEALLTSLLDGGGVEQPYDMIED